MVSDSYFDIWYMFEQPSNSSVFVCACVCMGGLSHLKMENIVRSMWVNMLVYFRSCEYLFNHAANIYYLHGLTMKLHGLTYLINNQRYF